MGKTISELRQELARQVQARDQAAASVANVRQLLVKADERRAADGARRWNHILDNLERALDLAKSQVTAYDQQVKQLERQLEELERTGRVTLQEVLPGESQAVEVTVPTDLQAAEKLMGMSLSDLSNLTLEQVAEMHQRLFEQPEPEPKKPEPTAANSPSSSPSTALGARIEHARKLREAMQASRPSGGGASFVERRQHVMLRSGFAKCAEGKIRELFPEEMDALIEQYKTLEQKQDLNATDERVKQVIAKHYAEIERRAAEVRRRNMFRRKR